MAKQRVIFFDDDIRAATTIGEDLVKVAAAKSMELHVDVIDPAHYSTADMHQACLDPTLSLVLIDRFLAHLGSARLLLEAKLNGLAPARVIPTYIISGYDIKPEDSESMLANWRTSLNNIFEIRGVLVKPITPELVLGLVSEALPQFATSEVAPATDILETLMKSFSLPARLLDNERRPVLFNDVWNWGGNVPAPLQNDDDRDFVANTLREDGRPGLVAYRISTAKVPDGRELQIAYPFDHKLSETFDIILTNLYRLLVQLGFKRMRYYSHRRVPGSDGVISLEKWFGDPKPNLNISWENSWRKGSRIYSVLDGYLASIFSQYEQNTRPNDFVYRILRGADEHQQNDPCLSFWNLVVGIGVSDDWFEFPILCKSDQLGTDKYWAPGMLIADRKGAPRSKIEPAEIERRALTLRAHCVELARLLKAESDHQRVHSLNRARQFFLKHAPQLNEANAFERYLKAVIDEARNVVGADVGMIAWKASPSSPAKVRAISVRDEAKSHFPKVPDLVGRYVRTSELPALAEAIERKIPIYRPNNLVGGEATNDFSFRNLSRFALPLAVGERIIGAIGFVDRRIRRFNQRRIDSVVHIVEDCAVMLDNLGAAQFRTEWEDTIMHEVSTLGVIAQKAIGRMQRLSTENEDLNEASWNIDLLLDRNLAFHRLKGHPEDEPLSELDPTAILAREFRQASTFARRRKKEFRFKALKVGSLQIWAAEITLGFIIRTMLENAIHHGQDQIIEVLEENNDRYWTLTVTNGGHMNEDENRLKYEPYAHPPNRRKDGSHTALPASRRWAERYGALLSVDNTQCGDQNFVSAILRWPILRNE